MEHTPRPWIDSPNEPGAIISTDPDAMADAGMEVKYYGGAVIAESIAPRNKPLLKAAPDLLAACKAQDEYEQHVQHCRQCDWSENYCETGYILWNTAMNLRAVGLAKASGETP